MSRICFVACKQQTESCSVDRVIDRVTDSIVDRVIDKVIGIVRDMVGDIVFALPTSFYQLVFVNLFCF